MPAATLNLVHPDLRSDVLELSELAQHKRLAALIAEHFDFVWRSLRRLGVPAAEVDDATQQVWLVLSRKLPEIKLGSERSFLFGTALRIASEVRRRVVQRREVLGNEALELFDPRPGADEALDRRQARSVLDEILQALPDDLRVVFVLYELEELTAAQIAELTAVPQGTVASRIRRARAEFEQVVKRLRARGQIEGER